MSGEDRAAHHLKTMAIPDGLAPEVEAMIGCALISVRTIQPPAALVSLYGVEEARSRALTQACLVMLGRFIADMAEPNRQAMLSAFPGFLRAYVARNSADDAERGRNCRDCQQRPALT